ncbi:MAG: tRNA (N6-isopentenyl adenosine(37)-C2)-methylthiotransferase MiaB [Candidatus Rokubacteria bacterium]|nr:tRNA (N6-isopentenyl adenosine(37)-C2)-methylthiotransferase MiaB [Candidatus Rokubacteria bacterium]
MAKLHVITYGCQMNEYDSERVAGLLKTLHNYDLTDREDDADLILLNTCSIREKAEEKVFSKLGQLKPLKRKNPELIIGVIGCMAQLRQAAIMERAPVVDLVFGSPAISRVGELVERVKRERRPVLETGEAPLVKITAKPQSGDRLKAFVTVMEGCDKFCAFCVVPYTRGRERSHSVESILAEIRGLAGQGYREVTLLGQNVNAYGKDLDPPTDLAALLDQVNELDGIERIRFVTSNPVNLTSRLIRVMAEVPKVCQYLHLPLQSGSDRVLVRMNRGYSRGRYLELIAELEETVPGIALSTDLIVGFPGESEEDFEATVEMVETVQYDSVFAFRYSPRPRTPAAEFPDQVPEPVKAARLTRLLEVANRVGAEKSRALEGRTLEVLVDGVSRKDPRELSGRTRCNRVVNFDGQGRTLYGELVRVRITQAMPHSLRGELVDEED